MSRRARSPASGPAAFEVGCRRPSAGAVGQHRAPDARGAHRGRPRTSPAVARLVPPAVPDDRARQPRVRAARRPTSCDGKVSRAIETLEATAMQERLEQEATLAWLRCSTTSGSMVGTRLDVTEGRRGRFDHDHGRPRRRARRDRLHRAQRADSSCSGARRPRLADGHPTWWSFNMFVVVRPAGDEAAITTASPGSASPCCLQATVHQRRSSRRCPRAARPQRLTPQSRHVDRRTSSGGMNAYTGTLGRSADRRRAVRPVSV